jgi:hypothetical protein
MSSTTSTASDSVTSAHGVGTRGISVRGVPTRDLNHWRSLSVSEIAATGRLNSRAAMRVMRSNASAGALSSRLSSRRACRRRCSYGEGALGARSRSATSIMPVARRQSIPPPAPAALALRTPA